MATDRELVNRARSGDGDAFVSLAKRYERSVLAVVQAEVREPLMAQNVTLVTMRRAYRRLVDLEEEEAFGPWLLRIARRQTINALRTMPIPVGPDNRDSAMQGCFDSSDPEWIESEHLLGLVNRLPEEERQLIGLHFFDKHTPNEIAAIVDRPVNDVTRQLARAVSRLRYRWEWEQES